MYSFFNLESSSLIPTIEVGSTALDCAVNALACSGEILDSLGVAILNASPRATIADAAIREILTVMSAEIIEEASITVPVIGAGLDEEGIFRHAEIAASLSAALAAIQRHLQAKKIAA